MRIWVSIRDGIRSVLLRASRRSGYVQVWRLGRAYLGPLGWTASSVRRLSVDGCLRPIPWWTYPAFELLQLRLPVRRLRVFEWGSGNSTAWWAARGADVVACEHDPKWCKPINGARVVHRSLAEGYVEEVRNYRDLDV